ncbi:collagen alpha-1(II) chain-like [Oenanthe melanoleuca]|uniref:collagen alpha-1(II) chain-like n=1 Tax=Oenanthe melanoleuca TaxID=2939378 RepID=UPI0024C120B2|nr:collagen alpha-1(II) chain-like [Oenanthe melanoleuca]
MGRKTSVLLRNQQEATLEQRLLPEQGERGASGAVPEGPALSPRCPRSRTCCPAAGSPRQCRYRRPRGCCVPGCGRSEGPRGRQQHRPRCHGPRAGHGGQGASTPRLGTPGAPLSPPAPPPRRFPAAAGPSRSAARCTAQPCAGRAPGRERAQASPRRAAGSGPPPPHGHGPGRGPGPSPGPARPARPRRPPPAAPPGLGRPRPSPALGSAPGRGGRGALSPWAGRDRRGGTGQTPKRMSGAVRPAGTDGSAPGAGPRHSQSPLGGPAAAPPSPRACPMGAQPAGSTASSAATTTPVALRAGRRTENYSSRRAPRGEGGAAASAVASGPAPAVPAAAVPPPAAGARTAFPRSDSGHAVKHVLSSQLRVPGEETGAGRAQEGTHGSPEPGAQAPESAHKPDQGVCGDSDNTS